MQGDITRLSLFFHLFSDIETTKSSLKFRVSGILAVFRQMIEEIVVIVVIEWNPIFQIIFIFEKKISSRFGLRMLFRRHLGFFFIFYVNLLQELVLEFYFSCHLSGPHGEFRNRFVSFASTGFTARSLTVIFFVSTVVDDLKRIKEGLCLLLVLILHAFKQIIL